MLKTKKVAARVDRLAKEITKPQKNLNVLIDADLLKRFKIKTATNEETMTDVLTDAIIEYLR